MSYLFCNGKARLTLLPAKVPEMRYPVASCLKGQHHAYICAPLWFPYLGEGRCVTISLKSYPCFEGVRTRHLSLVIP